MDLRDRRIDYTRASLDDDAPADPFVLFDAWLADALEAQAAGTLAEATTMTLATARALEGGGWQPEARIVLLKEWTPEAFVFFTNYDSAKGASLAANPHASLSFWWAELQRQVRVEGPVQPVPREDSEAYFAVRPRGSQVGAWASRQSAPIASRGELQEAIDEAEARFDGVEVPCPPHWGGYAVVPARLEFWQGRPSRLHDRLAFTRAGGQWQRQRLCP